MTELLGYTTLNDNCSIDTFLPQEEYICPTTKQEGNINLYSQHFEDYILSIVFANQNKGFYVDVGANSPDDLSVTKHFYLKGWRGINIDPIKANYDAFMIKRPDDINYNIGIADKSGELAFYENSYNAISGFSSAEDRSISHGNVIMQYKVQTRALTDILDENDVQTIDLLNIDVEGFEKQVLTGINFTKYQPKVIILESVHPQTLKPNHQKWEDILTKADYHFILFDSLNRHYLSKAVLHLGENYKKAYECLIQKLGKTLVVNPLLPPIFFNTSYNIAIE